jgi:hypothetical protein
MCHPPFCDSLNHCRFYDKDRFVDRLVSVNLSASGYLHLRSVRRIDTQNPCRQNEGCLISPPLKRGIEGDFQTSKKKSPLAPFFKGGILDPQSTTFNQTPQYITPHKPGGLPTGSSIQFFIVESQNFVSPGL